MTSQRHLTNYIVSVARALVGSERANYELSLFIRVIRALKQMKLLIRSNSKHIWLLRPTVFSFKYQSRDVVFFFVVANLRSIILTHL